MFRSYRLIILAAFGYLACASGALAQNNAERADSRPEIQSSTNRSAADKNDNAAETVMQADIRNRKQAIQSDCGSPKECRSEKRQQDDLIAQQTSAEAALSQRNATWWQTGIGAFGVLLLIATLIYTAKGTRAATRSVDMLVSVERARLASFLELDFERGENWENKTGMVRLLLSNYGKTPALVIETSIEVMENNKFVDLKFENVQHHDIGVSQTKPAFLTEITAVMGDLVGKYIAGRFRYKTMVSDDILTDYYCFLVTRLDRLEGLILRTGPNKGKDWPADN